jgi:hypothetical protein
MTSDRDFDRLARAWLERGPDEAPDRVIAAVLQAAETTPQVRRGLRWPTWRSFPMNRLPMAAGAVAVLAVVVGGGFLISRQTGPVGVGVVASPSPIAVPSPSAGSVEKPVPTDLQSVWLGAPRDVPGLLTAYRYRFELKRDTFRFPLDDFVQGQLFAGASIVDGDVLRLTSSDTTGGCQVGDVGTYTWSFSTSATRLTMTLVGDACTARRTALPGVWQRMTCVNPDDGCLGDLVEAGRYASQYFTPRLAGGGLWTPQWGALTYTVPAGWANSADWPNSFVLTPSDAYANEGPTGPRDGSTREISAFRLPFVVSQDAACVGPAASNSPTTVDGLIGAIRGMESVASSAPTSITIDGHPAKWIDVSIAPSWTESCPDVPSGQPVALLLGSGSVGADEHVIGLVGNEKMRLVFVDVGGQVALIDIDSSDPTRFDDLVTQAMPIIESFTFE